ncbi:MAG: glutathione S-transferase family protein [Alphaproteobacteria bacterium]|jgi:glutathione S-transferase|nr:glutathione S-transferase family protein [Alphaproteobacteria bacterium]
MLRVWGRRNSSNVQKVLWFCDEAALTFEHEEIGGDFGRTTDADMLARNPNARVPTIEDDGFVLWESNAILRYLGARYASGSMWPTDARARADADRWMDWQQSTVVVPLTTIFWGRVRTPEAYTEAQIAEAEAAAVPIWQILDARLVGREWIMGDSFTVADIPLAILAWRWFSLAKAPPAMAALDAWFARIRARPAFEARVAGIALT